MTKENFILAASGRVTEHPHYENYHIRWGLCPPRYQKGLTEGVERCRDRSKDLSERWTDLKVCPYKVIYFSTVSDNSLRKSSRRRVGGVKRNPPPKEKNNKWWVSLRFTHPTITEQFWGHGFHH